MSSETGETAARHLRVVDFGAGMPAALIAKQFAEMGAYVSRIEPEGGDPFYGVYPAYRTWRAGLIPATADETEALLAKADLCIVGGEDFPGLEHRRDMAALAAAHPHLIILNLVGYPTAKDKTRPAVDLLVQARSGAVYEQFSDRPVASGFPLPSYGTVLQGLLGAWVAIVERERSGRGQVVTVSMVAGAAMFWGPFWMKASRADDDFTNITPRDARHLILRCADDRFLQITLGIRGSVAKAYALLGIPEPVDPDERGMPDHKRGPANFYGYVDLLNEYSRNHDSESLLAGFHRVGVPCERILPPGANWDEEQVKLNEIVIADAAGVRSVGNPLRVTPVEGTGGAPAPLPPLETGAPPLAGLRIVDFGMFVAGPYASKLLADYGADVISIDPPRGRPTLSGERTIISAFHGKRSICVDAKAENGWDVITLLCRDADVVLNNFRPGVSTRLSLDPPTLRTINPDLVTLETTAYGPSGPKALSPGFDMVMQACSGLQYRAGGIDNSPLCSRTPLVDFATGALGATAILIGIYDRIKTGRACEAETNLLNTALHMMSELLLLPDGTIKGARTLDHSRTGFHPAESLYQTADGWIAIAARSSDMAAALAGILGADLPADRASWGEEERRIVAAKVASWATDDLLAALDEGNVWAEICVCDAWDRRPPDNHVFRQFDDATYGTVTHCIGSLIDFSRSPTEPSERLTVPSGADSRAILSELGATQEQVREWFDAGMVA
jgi:crotonobetainyl-CoA:carnitine CoA-transferase CaiB-like acyl-CoA transferase